MIGSNSERMRDWILQWCHVVSINQQPVSLTWIVAPSAKRNQNEWHQTYICENYLVFHSLWSYKEWHTLSLVAMNSLCLQRQYRTIESAIDIILICPRQAIYGNSAELLPTWPCSVKFQSKYRCCISGKWISKSNLYKLWPSFSRLIIFHNHNR